MSMQANNNVLSFNVMEKLVQALVEVGQMDVVADLFRMMQNNGQQPSQVSLLRSFLRSLNIQHFHSM